MKNLICKPNDIRLTEFIQEAMLMDKFIEIRIWREKASNKQMRYIHALFAIFGNEFGVYQDEAKQILKEKFLQYSKKGRMFVKSLADLNSLEMTNFVDQVRKFSSENGLYLLSPDEFYCKEAEVLNEINRYTWK